MKSQDSERIQHIARAFAGTKSSFVLSENIMQDMWHKYLFITVMSGVTTLMRAPMESVKVKAAVILSVMCLRICTNHESIRAPVRMILQEHMKTIDKISYDMKSSMQRDMEKGFVY